MKYQLRKIFSGVLIGILTITTLFAVLMSTVPAIANSCDTAAAETEAKAALSWHRDNGSDALMFWKIMNVLDPDHTIANPGGNDPTNSGGDKIDATKLEAFTSSETWSGWDTIVPAVKCVVAAERAGTVLIDGHNCNSVKVERKVKAALFWHRDNGSNALMFWKIMNALNPDHTIANLGGSDPTGSDGDTIELGKLELFVADKTWDGWDVIMPAVRCAFTPPAEEAEVPTEPTDPHPSCTGSAYDAALDTALHTLFSSSDVRTKQIGWRILWTLGDITNAARPADVSHGEESVIGEEVLSSNLVSAADKNVIAPVLLCLENGGGGVMPVPRYFRLDEAKVRADRGEWSRNTSYNKGDIVRPMNNWLERYIALQSSAGKVPSATSTSWEKITRNSPMRKNVKVFEVFLTRIGIEHQQRTVTIATEGIVDVSPTSYTETFGRTSAACAGNLNDLECRGTAVNTKAQDVRVYCTKGEEAFVTVSEGRNSERFQVCWSG